VVSSKFQTKSLNSTAYTLLDPSNANFTVVRVDTHEPGKLMLFKM